MKQVIFAIALSLIAPTLGADATWYAEDRNVTCTGHEADGSITCESGHIGNAPLWQRDHVPAIRGREPDAIEKRVTCGVPFLGGSTCFLHCFGLGYCNSYCDKGVCKCKCYDESTFLGGIDVCHRTTCH